MTINEKLFTITFTENEVEELHKLLNDLKKHYREQSVELGKKGFYQLESKARTYRNEFASLVNTHYMGDDA